jgi:hypothetical protein
MIRVMEVQDTINGATIFVELSETKDIAAAIFSSARREQGVKLCGLQVNIKRSLWLKSTEAKINHIIQTQHISNVTSFLVETEDKCVQHRVIVPPTPCVDYCVEPTNRGLQDITEIGTVCEEVDTDHNEPQQMTNSLGDSTPDSMVVDIMLNSE